MSKTAQTTHFILHSTHIRKSEVNIKHEVCADALNEYFNYTKIGSCFRNVENFSDLKDFQKSQVASNYVESTFKVSDDFFADQDETINVECKRVEAFADGYVNNATFTFIFDVLNKEHFQDLIERVSSILETDFRNKIRVTECKFDIQYNSDLSVSFVDFDVTVFDSTEKSLIEKRLKTEIRKFIKHRKENCSQDTAILRK
jgi:hypothetical protein